MWVAQPGGYRLSAEQAAVLPIIKKRLEDWQFGTESQPTTIGGVTGHDDVAGLAAMDWPKTPPAIQQFYGALIIQAWTVFESHSEDLWEAALNSHPTTLAVLGSDTRLSVNDLSIHNFAVHDKLGTILKNKKPVSFRTLEKIQETYDLAFSENGVDISKILHADDLRYAAAVRNLIIHRRGIVDDDFHKQTGGIKDVPMIDEGKPFPVTGALCARLADACRHAAIKLSLVVHAWIDGHPEKGRPVA